MILAAVLLSQLTRTRHLKQTWVWEIPRMVLVEHVRTGFEGRLWIVGANGFAYLKLPGKSKACLRLHAWDVQEIGRRSIIFKGSEGLTLMSLGAHKTRRLVKSAFLLPRSFGQPVSVLRDGIVQTIDEKWHFKKVLHSRYLRESRWLHVLDWDVHRGLLYQLDGSTNWLTLSGKRIKIDGEGNVLDAVFGWDGHVIERKVDLDEENVGERVIWDIDPVSGSERKVCHFPFSEAPMTYLPYLKQIALGGVNNFFVLGRHGLVAMSREVEPAPFCSVAIKGGVLFGTRGGDIYKLVAR